MESEKRIHLLIENAHDVIFRLELDKGYTFMSPSIERLLGHQPEDYYHDLTYYRKITFPDDLPKLENLISSLMEGEDPPRIFELRQFHKDGHLVHLEFTLTATRDEEGKIVALEGVARDITERKEAEEQLRKQSSLLMHTEKMNAMGTMVAGVTHELNNPMMGILNYAQYCLKHTPADDRTYPVLEDIERETKRCAATVQNMLTFARTEEEEEGYQKEGLADVLDRIIRLLSYRIEKEGVSVSQHIAEGTPEIWMKVSGIQQVLINLIGNALDALKDSEKKEIRVEAHHVGDFVQVIVADSGCGIAPEDLGKIYDPFHTTKPAGQGTGLGLSVSHTIIKEHRGEITCESEPGVGTKFTILLPVESKKGKEVSK